MADAKQIMELRQMTGAGVLDAKQALEASGGDLGKAAEELRKRGQVKAAKKADRETAEGLIGSYVHATGKVGVLVAVACETDFVARSDEFRELVHDLALHIAAANPLYLRREDVPSEVVAREREMVAAEFAESGKPAPMIEKIVNGKLAKFTTETCLLEQAFVKDEGLTVQQRIEQSIAKLGENVQVRRFCRFAL